MTLRVKMDRRGLAELRRAPGLGRILDKGATAIARGAPRGVPTKVRSGYRRSWKTEPASIEAGEMRARAVCSDFAWHLIEFGSANNPAYAPVRKAIEGSGMRFEDPGPGR